MEEGAGGPDGALVHLVRVRVRCERVRESESVSARVAGRSIGVPVGSSRFESLILSHHSRFACECNKEEINDDGGVPGRAATPFQSRIQHLSLATSFNYIGYARNDRYRGTSLIRKPQPPYDHPMTLGIVLR